ncbi:MAG: LysE family translocator [Rhodoferax sp.]
MNWQEFWALLALATAMSFTPGPNTALSTALAANHGLRRALPFVCAVPVGWALLLLVCALGLGALVLLLPVLRWGIKLIGVAYLLWLAARLAGVVWPSVAGRPAAPASLGALAQQPWRLFAQGVALQFVNIKAWMLALAIVGGWVTGLPNPAQRMALVLPVMLVYAFASNLSYAWVGALLRAWLDGPHGSGRRLRWFNRAMAALLGVTALWMLWL